MKIGRNDPCPCGSGKKFKKCCAAVAVAEPASAVAADSGVEPATPTELDPPQKDGGRDWVPLQHQQGRLRPSNFGRKKAR